MGSHEIRATVRRHRLYVTPGPPLYPPNFPAYANVGTTTNNWMSPNDEEKMDESRRTTTPGESHGVPEGRHHFGMRRLHPRCAEAAFPPGNQAQRIQLRGSIFSATGAPGAIVSCNDSDRTRPTASGTNSTGPSRGSTSWERIASTFTGCGTMTSGVSCIKGPRLKKHCNF